ncbi:hypothetical protein [Paenibacillus donghaensis]|uniref:Thioredoxin domain-containing protein n=1 Tax=Paenibacillus donghaensis TaxID=414771 RepID=A0A2Z2K2W6_9BACL|nr:hypothetical protein [Paenibacillus donghaensis]ASA19466.1 hypothetical protein B9T62_00520 [Paenibacillus donghaensis]
MDILQSTKTHHRFLKKATRNISQVGDYFPNFLIQEGKYIQELISDHLIIVALSTTCYPCKNAMQVLLDFLSENYNANLVILFSADSNEDFEHISELIGDKAKLFRMEITKLMSYFQGVPWGITLNIKGQILSSYPFDNRYWFDKIIIPVIKII